MYILYRYIYVEMFQACIKIVNMHKDHKAEEGVEPL